MTKKTYKLITDDIKKNLILYDVGSVEYKAIEDICLCLMLSLRVDKLDFDYEKFYADCGLIN